MPRQAFVYVGIILVVGALNLVMASNLLKVEQSWSDSLAAVKETNEKNAEQLGIQRRKITEVKAALTQANLGWDRLWNDVRTIPNAQQRTVQAEIGTDNGLAPNPQAPTVLHAFQPDGQGGYTYVGPFVAQPANVRQNNSVLVAAWQPLMSADGQPEASRWIAGNWRFRSQIPPQHKVRFESLTSRFGTDLQTYQDTERSIAKQNDLFNAANRQLDLRTSELQGSRNPDAEVDPLRPELTLGLITAIENEEEARNTLQLEVDALRRAILEAKSRKDGLLGQLQSSTSSTAAVPRLGAKPE